MSDIKYYFDNAAATPLLPAVRAAMAPYMQAKFYNPSALYLGARQNRLDLEAARHSIAQGLGTRSTEIIYTAGGTEANNLAIRGVLEAFTNSHAISTAVEHASVLEPLRLYDHSIASVDSQGLVDASTINKLVKDNTVLLSVIYANNEIGAIQPIREISAMVRAIDQDRKRRHVKRPLYLHVDACQATNYLDMQVNRLGVDLMTINAGKIYGPKQCGALYLKKGIRLRPLILGGGQEWNKRSGTENLANVVGFATAWQQVRADYQREARRLSYLRDEFLTIISQNLPAAVINGPIYNRRLPNNINLTIPGQDNERLIMQMDEAGMQLANGSACSASSGEPSHVLKAIGLSEAAAHSSLRITFGRYTTSAAIRKLAITLAGICQ